MNKSHTFVKIKGLKCDNPDCCYQDMSISFEEYPRYVGAKCPECGAVLLTNEDYDTILKIVKFVEILNKIPLPKFMRKEGYDTYSAEMNGTGKVRFLKNK